jgi:uncharacterized membrane protein
VRGFLTAVLVLLAVVRVEAQSPLEAAAERARAAWADHDVAALVADSPRLLVQLPGTDPSVALGPDQAAALLDDFLARANEVETTVKAAREVERGRGYVELDRKYRVEGTQEVRTQSLLLGYRESRSGWVLIELRVVGGDG